MFRMSSLLLLVMSGVALGGLTKNEAETAVAELSQQRLAMLKAERAAEIEAKSITIGDKTMKWLEKTFGDAPEGKRSLWISMHGGGQTASSVNDQQWKNQLSLYQPKEGIYVAPRAPTDTWNLWHQDHIDPLFVRLIEGMIATRGVDPDKVYLMGYSAGGDGAWQLAPRMADRFAAVAMMAGHPGDANLEGVRNVAFGIFCGANDAAYDRNKRTKEGGEKLAELQKNDPEGYPHMCRVYPGLGHWMNLRDAEAVPWMEGFQRRTWPQKIVWVQDDVTHSRFYWISLSEKNFPKGSKLVATVEGQTISLEGLVPPGTSLWLSDELLNLDQPVTVKVNGKVAFSGKVKRTKEAIAAAIEDRLDLNSCPTAKLPLP
jgi:pimeloyl-ACP methyl ester carboxylesterase